MATTTIDFGGTLDVILAMIDSHQLTRTSGAHNHGKMSARVTYHGNFVEVSHAFSVTSDDPEVCQKMHEVMTSNIRRFGPAR